MPNRVPNVTFKTRVRNDAIEGDNPFEWKDLTTSEIFDGKRVVVFALPGAFTPTCSTSHLPRYEELYAEFQELGVDAVICLSVNDAFTCKMGMLVDKSNLGFGMRSWRYSMVVDNGEIEQLFEEPDFGDNCPTDPFEVSDADTMLSYLKSKAQVDAQAA